MRLKPFLLTVLAGVAAGLILVAIGAATGLIHPHYPATLADGVVGLMNLGLDNLRETGMALATAPVALVSKNPQALEFRAKADELQAELLDPAKQFSKDDVEKRASEIAALRARADAIAKFTPDDALTRRGGDQALTIASPTGADVGITGKGQVEALKQRAIKEFGSLGKMVRALARGRSDTAEQEAVLRDLHTLTRTIVGTASDASGGEYLLPLTQEPSIFRVSNKESGIMQFARRYNVPGRTLRIPYLKQASATGASGVETLPISGGIADISIVGEGGTKPVREPAFNQRLMTVYKWAAYTEFGDEVLDDDFTGELQQSVLDIIGQQLLNTMDDKMTVTGTGTSEPLAALHANNPSRLSIPSRAGAGTIGTADIFKMFSRHTLGPKSYWSVSRRVIEALLGLTLGSNTLVTFLPDLRQSPSGMLLLGLPVVMNDFQSTLGTIGDIALINPDFYAVGLRQQVTIDTSEHYRFRDDITAVRFLARAGGIPIPDGTYAYRAIGTTKTDEHSPFVVIPT